MPDSRFDLAGRRIWVAGHRGMLGSAVVRRLASEGCEILTVAREELDLCDQAAVKSWFDKMQPEVVVLAAARVGGVLANSRYPASFLSDNLAIQDNVIRAAAARGVKKLLFVSSSCVYPRLAEQPIREEALMTGPLEPTNVWYGVAKIAGMMVAPVEKDDLSSVLEMKRIFEKSIVAAADLAEGTELQQQHFAFKKPGDGISAARYREFIGRRLARSLPRDHKFGEEDFA